MTIAIPPRKGLVAMRIAESNPGLPLAEVARRACTAAGYVAKAVVKERFGRDKPKSRASDALGVQEGTAVSGPWLPA